jgi:hypothetical protein
MPSILWTLAALSSWMRKAIRVQHTAGTMPNIPWIRAVGQIRSIAVTWGNTVKSAVAK